MNNEKIKKRGNVKSIREFVFNNLNVSSLEDINNWFRKSYANNYRIDKLSDAAQLTIKEKHRVAYIFGDYDVDGTSGTSILYLGLKKAGFKNVNYLIPDRELEGYGANMRMANEVSPNSIVFFVDNGIACHEVIRYLKEKQCIVIILDHHEAWINPNTKEIEYPDADIIIDPCAIRNSADFDGYCGAGLAYRFIGELYSKCFPETEAKIETKKLQGLAAIGTICDVMSLHEENYVIVRNGLKCLLNPNFCTMGLYALLSTYELTERCSAQDIGYKIGPSINSMSRLDGTGALEVVKLLIYNTNNWPEALEMANNLYQKNELRKNLSKEGIEKANEIIENNQLNKNKILLVYIPNIKEGLIGIIAGELAEKHHCPTIVFTDSSEEDILKGSGRSVGTFHMKENLDKIAPLILKYGGHKGAAGLSVQKKCFNQFCSEFETNADNYEVEDKDTLFYDLDISVEQVADSIKELKMFEPYGEGHPIPVFRIKDFTVIQKYGEYKKILGENKKHVKFYGIKNVEAIGFNLADDLEAYPKPKSLCIIGNLVENHFNGKVTNQINCDFIEVNEDNYQTTLANTLIEMASQRNFNSSKNA